MKLCCSCQETKPFSDFHRNSAKPDGYHNQCKTCRRIHYDNNRERILAYNIDWNGRNRDVIEKHNRKRVENPKGRAKQLWTAANRRACEKGIEFSVSLTRIEFALVVGKCERTGIPFDYSKPDKTKTNPFAPSVDKIDPFGGYTEDNIKVVCVAYNFAKGQMSHEQFVEFCRKVIEFNS